MKMWMKQNFSSDTHLFPSFLLPPRPDFQTSSPFPGAFPAASGWDFASLPSPLPSHKPSRSIPWVNHTLPFPGPLQGSPLPVNKAQAPCADSQTPPTSKPAGRSACPASRPLPKPLLPPHSRLTVEGEGEVGGTGQAGVLGAPPGADRGGEQRGALVQALLLVSEAEEAMGVVTQQEVVLAVAKVQSASMAVPVEAEVVDAPGVGKTPGSRGDFRKGGVDYKGCLRVLDGDVQLFCLLIMETALLCLVPLATEAEVFPENATMGT